MSHPLQVARCIPAKQTKAMFNKVHQATVIKIKRSRKLKHTGWYFKRLLMIVNRICSNKSGSSTFRPVSLVPKRKIINSGIRLSMFEGIIERNVTANVNYGHGASYDNYRILYQHNVYHLIEQVRGQ